MYRAGAPPPHLAGPRYSFNSTGTEKKPAEKIIIKIAVIGVALLIFLLSEANNKYCTGIYDEM